MTLSTRCSQVMSSMISPRIKSRCEINASGNSKIRGSIGFVGISPRAIARCKTLTSSDSIGSPKRLLNSSINAGSCADSLINSRSTRAIGPRNEDVKDFIESTRSSRKEPVLG